MPEILWWLGAVVLMFLVGTLIFVSPAFDQVKARQTIRRHSSSLYNAFSKLPDKNKKRAVFAVYAFSHAIDEAVDAKKSKDAFEKLEIDFMQAIEGQRVKHWMFAELMWAVETYCPEDYDYQPYFELIQGKRRDLNHQPFQTVKQLIEYSTLVAGAIGRMLTPILAGEETADRKRFAVDLGVAMHLTNILRDIGKDDLAGKRYIPDELLEKHGIDWNAERQSPPSDAFVRMMEEVSEMARSRYDSAITFQSFYPPEVRIPLGLAMAFHRAILDRIKQNGYDVFVRRAVVSEEEKRRIAEQWLPTEASGEKR